MKRLFFFVVSLICFATTVIAQNVSYYKMANTIKNGITSTDVSGGQFICIVGNDCCESNKFGVSVGNGLLKYCKASSDEKRIVYIGSSYWGDNTTFVFNSDKSKLVVVDNHGNKYVYKRDTPPAGVTTCSLIRKQEKKAETEWIPGPTPNPFPPQPNPYSPMPTPNPTPTPTPNPREVRQVTKDCTACHGSGNCANCDGKKWHYGIGGAIVDCTNCNRTGNCPYCGGRGKITKTELY